MKRWHSSASTAVISRLRPPPSTWLEVDAETCAENPDVDGDRVEYASGMMEVRR